MMRILVLLLLLLGAPAPMPARIQAVAQATLSDGPYVIWKGSEARLLQVRDGGLIGSARKGPFSLALPGLAPGTLRLDPRPPVPGPAEFPLPAKILAVSDVHGNLPTLLNLLKAHGVADANLRWTFGQGHLVVVGDVFDRGPQATEVFWLIRSLEAQAAKVGGRVHMLLGNHEAMVLKGDLRYLHPKYQKLLRGTLPMSLPELYGPDSELGRWLRTRPTLLRLGPYLFVHGGLSPAFLDLGLGIRACNKVLRENLDSQKANATVERLFGPEGPLWYRGMVAGPDEGGLETEVLERALKAFKVRAVVVGHTTLERVSSLHGGKVFGIDGGMKGQATGEAWICSNGKLFRGGPDGRLEALVP